jgi:hypothetical protein
VRLVCRLEVEAFWFWSLLHNFWGCLFLFGIWLPACEMDFSFYRLQFLLGWFRVLRGLLGSLSIGLPWSQHTKKRTNVILWWVAVWLIAPATDQCLTSRAMRWFVITASWKKWIETCCDRRIQDQSSLMERCPYYYAGSFLDQVHQLDFCLVSTWSVSGISLHLIHGYYCLCRSVIKQACKVDTSC